MAQYAKTAEVRRGIVDACLAAFGESGFNGISMAEIARRAGISHTGLLHHFPRKEDLLTAVLDLQDERGAGYLEAQGADPFGSDALEVLRGMVAALVQRDRYAGLVELNAVLGGEATTAGHPAHDRFALRYANIRSFLTRLFTTLREQDRLTTPLSPAQLAALMVATTEGLNLQWLYARDAVDVEGTLLAFLSTAVRGLDAHSPE